MYLGETVRRWLAVAALLLLTTACGKPPVIDVTFIPYLDKFKEEAEKHEIPVTIEFSVGFGDPGKKDSHTAGLCGLNGITIKKAFWDSAEEADKEQLMFHELTHCVFKLPHVKTVSIMYPIMLRTFYYIDHRDQLVKELFESIRINIDIENKVN